MKKSSKFEQKERTFLNKLSINVPQKIVNKKKVKRRIFFFKKSAIKSKKHMKTRAKSFVKNGPNLQMITEPRFSQ